LMWISVPDSSLRITRSSSWKPLRTGWTSGWSHASVLDQELTSRLP
jgi:hypothetical protein